MSLTVLDWSIIASYIVLSVVVGALLARRASSSVLSFFAADRSLGWGLVGVSIAATTFASDTPLAVVELVRREGAAANWLWWSFAISHILIAVLFARMWRSSGVVTDAEILELRYSGRPAAALRTLKAFYLAVIINVMTMAWVLLAMTQVVDALVPWDSLHLPSQWTDPVTRRWLVTSLLAVVAFLYSAASGLWGVVMTDALQMVVALAGSFALAWFVLRGVDPNSFPKERFITSPLHLSAKEVLLFLGVQWWANKYADGGGYLVQRLAAVRKEEDAPKAVWTFAFIHYLIRPWPWIIVGVASLVVFPGVTDHKRVYPMMMARFLPSGWLGLAVASFAAAFMSTIDTHLNWGASYVVRDLWQRFVPSSSERTALWVGRAASGAMLAGSVALSFGMDSISGAWKVVILLGSGLGPVLVARWLWWRVNGWSELSAFGTSLVVATATMALGLEYADALLVTVALSTAVALVVTLATPPEPEPRLRKFFAMVRPPGPGWRRFGTSRPLWPLVLRWAAMSAGMVLLLSLSGWILALV